MQKVAKKFSKIQNQADKYHSELHVKYINCKKVLDILITVIADIGPWVSSNFLNVYLYVIQNKFRYLNQGDSNFISTTCV